MPTAASGAISLAEDHLCDMLAACDTFQDWVLAITEEQARRRIWIDALPPPSEGAKHSLQELEEYRPYATVSTGPEEGFALESTSTTTRRDSGVLMCELTEDIPSCYRSAPGEIARIFKNTLGNICAELMALSSPPQAGYLAIRKVSLTEGPYREDPAVVKRMGDWQGAELKIEWY